MSKTIKILDSVVIIQTEKTKSKDELKPFFKSVLTRSESASYEKVLVDTLYTMFKIWCKSKHVKCISYDTFYDAVADEYKIRENKNGDKYLEKIKLDI